MSTQGYSAELVVNSNRKQCFAEIKKYDHVVSWVKNKRLRIRAAKACLSRPKFPIVLENVSLEIVEEDVKSPKFFINAPQALLSWQSKQIVFNTDAIVKFQQQKIQLPGVVVNWIGETIRATNGFFKRI